MKKKAFCILLLLVLVFSLLLVLNRELPEIPRLNQLAELLEAEPLRWEDQPAIIVRNSVLAGEYWEKMTMAMNSLFTLAAVAKQWAANMPLPFTSDSFLFGLPTGKNLDMIYDREGINALMKQYHLPPFITFEEFMQSASRSVIVLELMFELAKDSSGKHIHDGKCTRSSTSLLSRLNQHASKRSLQSFHVMKCCHIVALQSTSPLEISTFCGILNSTTNVTVLLSQWRGIDNLVRYRLQMNDFNIPHPGPSTPVPYSATVVNQSTAILKTHLKKHTKFVGVHLRSERIWLYIYKQETCYH